ncbi:MAG: ribosome maturation factor, partial [Bacteroidetes bacterium]|nr:ribosome maturation factor [Bacteroidota bacterium]
KNIEETALFPDGNFSLEVSSPGIDEPLKLHRQYEKNKGRNVEVVLNDGTVYEAVLSGIYENGIQLIITEGKGKKAVTKQLDIAMADIKHTKVKIKF